MSFDCRVSSVALLDILLHIRGGDLLVVEVVVFDTGIELGLHRIHAGVQFIIHALDSLFYHFSQAFDHRGRGQELDVIVHERFRVRLEPDRIQCLCQILSILTDPFGLVGNRHFSASSVRIYSFFRTDPCSS